MPLPFRTLGLINGAEDIAVELTAVETAIAALPPVPVEADLPDIVQIVEDLRLATTNLQVIVADILEILSTTRVSQRE